MMLLLLSALIFVVGCDSDSDSDNKTVKVDGVFVADSSCQDEGKKVYIAYPEKNICINSDQIGVTGTDNVYGFTVPNGDGLIEIRRDGDYSDGTLKEVGDFDVAQYPYHLSFTTVPTVGANCEMSNDCTTIYALKGRWSVAAISPFKGDLMATSVVGDDQENCWDDTTGDLSGCSDVKNDSIKFRWSIDQVKPESKLTGTWKMTESSEGDLKHYDTYLFIIEKDGKLEGQYQMYAEGDDFREQSMLYNITAKSDKILLCYESEDEHCYMLDLSADGTELIDSTQNVTFIKSGTPKTCDPLCADAYCDMLTGSCKDCGNQNCQESCTQNSECSQNRQECRLESHTCHQTCDTKDDCWPGAGCFGGFCGFAGQLEE